MAGLQKQQRRVHLALMQSLLQVSSRQPTQLGSLLHALAAPLLSCTLQDARLDAALASEQHPLSAPPSFLEDVQGAQRWELYLQLWRALMAAPEALGGRRTEAAGA